jgi:hypothetical protein
MYFDLFTKWYILLPLAFSIGPIFSLTGVDGMIHTLLHNAGGGTSYRYKNSLTQTVDQIIRGTPYWIVISSILNILWGSSFPWIFITLILIGGIMKIVFGRAYIIDSTAETIMKSSRVWNSINKRGIKEVPDELFNATTQIANDRDYKLFAYPSLHTITTLGAIYFTSCNPALWFFLPPLLLWMLWVNHHWFSDILSGCCLVWGTVDLLTYIHHL